MSQSVYSVVKLVNNEIDDVAVFDTEEAANEYANELAEREEYQQIVVMWTKLNNTNMQVTVNEMRK
ncbi:putative CoA-binding protein [Desulfohalotomaculum tongense]|uniref:hypothetical protein n=1 Tax=Desulforadius tongensis TaxID=1216062 RepID=UPI00195CE5BC|nr:hypothetical protein [Desulforadius tongensis]MBM7854828.1 putative CoA-binding protein [Desulforadius tongensis]